MNFLTIILLWGSGQVFSSPYDLGPNFSLLKEGSDALIQHRILKKKIEKAQESKQKKELIASLKLWIKDQKYDWVKVFKLYQKSEFFKLENKAKTISSLKKFYNKNRPDKRTGYFSKKEDKTLQRLYSEGQLWKEISKHPLFQKRNPTALKNRHYYLSKKNDHKKWRK